LKIKDYIIPLLAVLCVLVLLSYHSIPQDLNYHKFADEKILFGIPNFLNVITNLPFGIIGGWGLRVAMKIREKELQQIFITLFIAFVLLMLGSGYYHLAPSNETLVDDRLPMVVLFMSFFSFIIYDYINPAKGYIAFITLNIIGIATVIYWIVTEHDGEGDLRWYGLVQFFPIIAILLILILYKSAFNYKKEIILIFLFFGLAKLCESFDREIYNLLSNTISGHSLKHIFVAAAEYEILLLIRKRISEGDILERASD
jgi:hypothetical protein